MSTDTRRFFIVLRDASGHETHAEEVRDFRSLSEDLAFAAVRRGTLPNDGSWGQATVEPEWRHGSVSGITVTLAGLRRTYPLSSLADRILEILVQRGLAADETRLNPDTFRWAVEIRDAPATTGVRRTVRWQPYPLRPAPLSEFGIPSDVEVEHPFGVLISGSLLRTLQQESAESLGRERADFLTGHLVQPASDRAAAILLDRIPAARDTASSPTHFQFAPTTFQAARSELERLGTDQVILGWHHNHPPPCGHDCLKLVPACKTDNGFFSVADRHVHRSGFNRPYMVALVSGKAAHRRADDPAVRAYGWRDGVIDERPLGVF